MGRQRINRYGWLAVLTLLLCICFGGLSISQLVAQERPPQMAFADPAQYPPRQFPDEGYLPVAQWSGRLILPAQRAAEAAQQDWVWIELFTSPESDLVGQRLRLQWRDTPENQTFLRLVTRGIEFDADAIASLEQGIVLPTRLNGWNRVGPLQSLAGTRPQDDMIVALPDAALRISEGEPVIEIEADPVQIPERFYSLVTVLGPDKTKPAPELCPGSHPCASDYLRVQHYNLASQSFDGAIETVRIPQVPPAKSGVFQSTSQELADSPAAEAGWYIYGAKNTEGIFVTRAMVPRRLFQLRPQETLSGTQSGLNYINFGNWRNTPERKGTLQSVLVQSDARSGQPPLWAGADPMLVIHLFGGIGGTLAEPRSVPGTVTGHFAFGQGRVVTDPFTQEPRLEVIYDQVYSHGPQGIVAGRALWAEYSGNLQRGWQGTRPISDVVVNIPALNHTYQFGDFTLSPLEQLRQELRIMMARYRTGDGTGASIVTPAQSCVQDSSQALYETIQNIRTQLANAPQVQNWLANHPADTQTLLFQDLISLGQRLQGQLVPLGIARPDWRENASILAGTDEEAVDSQPTLENETNLINNLLSWRTVIPRVAYDNIAAILLRHGGELWFLRTNQVGGKDPTILPLAPTELFGDYVVIPVAFSRLIESLKFPNFSKWSIMVLGLGMFALTLMLLGDRDDIGPPHLSLNKVLGALLAPALWQELVFRVLLLPHPAEGVQPITALLWSVISLGAFLAYRTVQARHRKVNGSRAHSMSLSLVLGILATAVYLITGSLWTAVGLHWGSWIMQQSSLKWSAIRGS